MTKRRIAIANTTIYLAFVAFTIFAWKTKDFGAGAYAAGGALGLCLFIPGFPLIYTPWLYVKNLILTRDSSKAKDEAVLFWRSYVTTLLFTPIFKSRKRSNHATGIIKKSRKRK
ncbi:MAG TPA: hypothetical protein VFM05_10980 [Candidatus Saccharimonadales bacterium]|nr:hypothetical protein [Candidatus Saccharimonadales bacterium]